MLIFTAKDAGGEPCELIPGLDFITYRQRVDTEHEAIASFTPIGGFAAVQIRHGWDGLLTYSDDTLARFQIVKTEVPDPEPPEPGPFDDLPAEVPMYKVRKYWTMVRLSTGRDMLAEITDFIETLPEPNRSLALDDLNFSPNLVVRSALALGAKAALGLDDTAYAEMIRECLATP